MLNYHIGYFVYILGVRNTFKIKNIKCKVIEKVFEIIATSKFKTSA